MRMFSCLVLLLVAPAANAQSRWGAGPCVQLAAPVFVSQPQATFQPVFQPAPQPSTAGWFWKHTADAHHLYRDGKHVGGFFHDDGKYWSAANGEWAKEPSDSPVGIPDSFRSFVQAKPAAPAPVIGDVFPTGVDTSKISTKERCTFKGLEIAQGDALRLVGKPALSDVVDDSGKDRLSFMATDPAKRKAAMTAFKSDPIYAALRKSALPWEGTPDDWSYEPGFPKKDNQVILQTSAGKVIARAAVADIADAPAVVNALRKANPSYDPLKDPTPDNKTPTLPNLGLQKIPVEWVLIGGVAILFFLGRKS